MHLDNNAVNSLLNTNHARGTFSNRPNLHSYVDEQGSVLSGMSRMPLIDFMRLLIEAGLALHPADVHPQHLVGLFVSTDVARTIVMNVFRAAEAEPELFKAELPLPKQVEVEVKEAVKAHQCAQRILKQIANGSADTSMDKFVSLTKNSPNPSLTKKLLGDAGPNNQSWVCQHGTLSALNTPMPSTLRAVNTVEVLARVKYVRESVATAMIEIVDVKCAYSQSVLQHFNGEVALSFDAKSIELDDLILLQYRKEVFSLRAAAECATLPRSAAKTRLTLRKILISREHLNRLHAEVKQITLPFGEM